MTEKDVVMKDDTKSAKTEEVKASEPQDPFFGNYSALIMPWCRVQEEHGLVGESSKGKGLQTRWIINQII